VTAIGRCMAGIVGIVIVVPVCAVSLLRWLEGVSLDG
jgi:hypothetical protein